MMSSQLRGRAGRRLAGAGCLGLAFLLGPTAEPAPAAEYRDPEGRFTITLPEGFREVEPSVLQARLERLRRAGTAVPPFRAAFDRGGEPRLQYPYALLEGASIPGAGAWTTADLEALLGTLDTDRAAREAAAALERAGLGRLMRDPQVTFVRWEPERQGAAYRIRARAGETEVLGSGRVYFTREGYLALWFYYLPGTPYAEVAEGFTAALTVLPPHRVPGAWLTAGRRAVAIGAGVAAAGTLVAILVWRVRRRAPPPPWRSSSR